MRGWADPNWNWGSAIGTAHDLAMELRARLNADRATREAWIAGLCAGSVDLEEAKLALGLRIQKAKRKGLDGDGAGWRLMNDMAACKYEGEEALLASDLEDLVAALPGDFDAGDVASPAARAAARALVGMQFVEDGL